MKASVHREPCFKNLVPSFLQLALICVVATSTVPPAIPAATPTGNHLARSAQSSSAQHRPVIQVALQPKVPRPVTTVDVIQMTKLADSWYTDDGHSTGSVAEFSPDGKKFIVVVRRGNLDNNTNEYSILLWPTSEAFQSPQPVVLLTMVSSSNRPGIQSLIWRPDNETIMFLGETPGELQQIYSFNIRTHILTKLTNSPTNVVAYSVTDRGLIAYFAEEIRSAPDPKTRRLGLPISTQMIMEVLLGDPGEEWSDHVRLIVQPSDDDHAQTLSDRVLKPFPSSDSPPIPSPDGRYVLLLVNVEPIPTIWKEYRDPLLKKWTVWKTTTGQYSMLRRYVIFDIQTGQSRILLNGPISFSATGPTFAAWAPDSRSVVIANAYLPLDEVSDEERETRRDGAFTVEVSVVSGEIKKIPSGEMKLVTWDPKTNELVFERKNTIQDSAEGTQAFFRKIGGIWEKDSARRSTATILEIHLEQGLNTPPQLFAIRRDTKERSLLFDLNPQFKNLKFGREEPIRWKSTDGHEVEGGLYYPVDYVPGKRYPLVIQTHGFHPDRFEIDGPYTSVFAAQPLAGKGIMVLQAEKPDRAEVLRMIATPAEADWKKSAYEGAIDYLDNRGLIDRARVGIMGFSRSCWHVKYTLTHSKYKFAAASVSDGIDMGYFIYTSMANRAYPDNEMDQIIGGLPAGKNLDSWFVRSPDFNIDKIPGSLPVRVVACYPLDVLVEWEWFAMMKRLGKLVDMVVFLDGTHVEEKPYDRMISQNGNVDWFDFWLNNHEDADPEKAEQYTRWRDLRDRRNKIVENSSPATSN
jgi:hypothetical protein